MSHACYYVIQIDGTYHTTTVSVSTAMYGRRDPDGPNTDYRRTFS